MKLGSSTGSAYTNDTWTNQSVYIEPANGTDEHSGHNTTIYSISGATTLNNQTEGMTLTETGIYTITVTTIDNVGNASTNTYTVKIDKVAPTAGTLTMKLGSNIGEAYANDTWTNQNVYIEQVEGTDEHSGHKFTTYSVNGPIALENQTVPTTLTEEGIYTITVTTSDNMENIETNTYTVKIDKTAPTAGTLSMRIDNSEGPIYTNDTWTNQSIYISPSNGVDKESGHRETIYSVSGATTLEDQTEAMTLTETGIYTIIVTTTDYAGNTSTNSYTIKIDKTNPTAGTLIMRLENSEGEAYTNNTWTNQSVYIETVNGEDEHSGHSRTKYSVSGEITLEDQTEAITLTETGIYTITVTTIDIAENTAINLYTIKIDKTAPTAGTLIMKLEGSEGEEYTDDTWTNQSVYIEPVNGSDENSGHNRTTYSVSGAITLEDQTEAMTLTETGIYTITVETIDNMGYTATNIYTIKIDKVNPTCRNTNYETRRQ